MRQLVLVEGFVVVVGSGGGGGGGCVYKNEKY